jgi:hypothetical protein
MREILLALAVVGVVLFAGYWMMQPTAARYAPSEITTLRNNDPAFRAEQAAEEEIARVREAELRATTQPSTRPS